MTHIDRKPAAKLLEGDVVWADLDPSLGREQAGHGPVAVTSHYHACMIASLAARETRESVDDPGKLGYTFHPGLVGKG
jgi:hypothetical protein